MATAFDVYDTTGGQSFTGATVVNLDTTRTDEPSASSPFSLSADAVTVSTPGVFLITGRVSAAYSSGVTSGEVFKAYLHVDTGGGFALVTGTDCYGAPTGNTSEPDTASFTVILSVADGDIFKLLVDRIGSTNTYVTTADASSLSFAKLSESGNKTFMAMQSGVVAAAAVMGDRRAAYACAGVIEEAMNYAEGSLTEDAVADAITFLTAFMDGGTEGASEVRNRIQDGIDILTTYQADS